MQSFMAKMNPQGDNTQPEDGTQWWMKYLGKGAGVVGGGGKQTPTKLFLLHFVLRLYS